MNSVQPATILCSHRSAGLTPRRAVPHGLPSRNRAVHGLRVVVVSTWRRRISTRPGRRGVAASSAGASAAAEGAAGGAERRKQLSLEKFLMLPEKWTKATNASANARSPSPTSDAETASSRLGATRARRQLMLENAAAKGDLEHLRDLLEVCAAIVDPGPQEAWEPHLYPGCSYQKASYPTKPGGPHAVEHDDGPDEGAESEAPTVDALVEDQEEASVGGQTSPPIKKIDSSELITPPPRSVDNIETQPMLPSEAAVYAKAYEAKQRNARKSKAYRRAYKEAQDNGLSAEECGASAMGWKTRASLKGVRGSGGDLNLLPSRLTLYSILNQDTGGLTLFVFQVFFWMALHGGLSAKRSVFFGNVCSMGQLDKGKLTNKERAKRTKNTTTRKYVDKSGKKRFVGDKKALKASQYRPWYFAWCSQ
ncbi:unnamed protein product [Durusdinium trenchii]|uniref:Uncharacterized protein n=1 Tax=Durusdinium trenchii TaxID=1381693 RepID=A0ABP0RK91_9DINO